MTKNVNSENSAEKRIVRVLSADGEELGSTYPKRARGLVKKGRAHFVNDCEIQLDVSDGTYVTEETKMDNNINVNLSKPESAEQTVNRLYFNAREWSFNKDTIPNFGERSFMNGPDGALAEGFTIGNWWNDKSEIVSKTLTLPLSGSGLPGARIKKTTRCAALKSCTTTTGKTGTPTTSTGISSSR
jgi:hypothetical protein